MVRTPTPKGPGSARSGSDGAIGAGSVVVVAIVVVTAEVDGEVAGLDTDAPQAEATNAAAPRMASR